MQKAEPCTNFLQCQELSSPQLCRCIPFLHCPACLLRHCKRVVVKGGDDLDSVSFSLTGRVPYKSWMEIDPSKINIELYNVQSNINWITQLSSAKMVKNVWYEQTESDVLRITIELVKQQHYGYSIGYNGRSLLLTIRRMPTDIRKMTIAIDAGHGGTNLGASGVSSGILEKNYTILFARELQQILKKQKINVLMVRENDTTIENKDRVLWAQQNNPDLFISFHLNSSGRSTAKGVSTYYKHMGYSPQLLAGVWVGCDDRFVRLNKNDTRGYGGTAARPIWESFYKKVYADKKLGIDRDARFSKPDDLELEMNSADPLNLIDAIPAPAAEGEDQGVGNESDFEIMKTREYIGPESRPVTEDGKEKKPKDDQPAPQKVFPPIISTSGIVRSRKAF